MRQQEYLFTDRRISNTKGISMRSRSSGKMVEQKNKSPLASPQGEATAWGDNGQGGMIDIGGLVPHNAYSAAAFFVKEPHIPSTIIPEEAQTKATRR
jgi:hypothetical protein